MAKRNSIIADYEAQSGESVLPKRVIPSRRKVARAPGVKRPKKRDRVWERKNKDGSTSYLAVVRIKPYKPASKSFASKEDAKKWANDLVEELRERNRAGEKDANYTALTIKELVEKFLGDVKIKGDGTPNYTQQKWYPDLEYLLAWWTSRYGSTKVREFGEDQITEARDLLCKGRKLATVNRYLAAMRRCWNKAQKKPPPWPKELTFKEPKPHPRFLGDAERKAVLLAAENHSAWMYAAVVTSIGTGLRQGELLRLTWEDIDFDKLTVTVLLSKTDTPRTVHIPLPALTALKKLRRVGAKTIFMRPAPDARPIDKGFLNVNWKRVRKTAKLQKFRWHDLRHTTASYLAQNGANLLEIGTQLGHTSPTVTKRYAWLQEGQPVTGADKLATMLGAKL